MILYMDIYLYIKSTCNINFIRRCKYICKVPPILFIDKLIVELMSRHIKESYELTHKRLDTNSNATSFI